MADNTTVEHGKKKRNQIVEFIISYIEKYGYAPSIREIG